MAASASHLSFTLPNLAVPMTAPATQARLALSRRSSVATVRAGMLGDFGAAEPKLGKMLGGMFDDLTPLSLSQMEIVDETIDTLRSLPEAEIAMLLEKLNGWRIIEEGGSKKLERSWKVKDYGSGVELMNRISQVVVPTGQFPNLLFEQPNVVKAQFAAPAFIGLSMNFFIAASKVDYVKTLDLDPPEKEPGTETGQTYEF